MTFAGIAFSLLSVLVLVAVLVLGFFVMATMRIAANAEKQVPFSGSVVNIEGGGVRCVEQGSGPPILFLHGLGGQLHHFIGPLFEHFAEGTRLVAIDRPGSGYSTRAASRGGTLAEQARAVREVIESLGLDRPLVVGHSLGGAVALALAIDHPDAVAGVALVSPLTRHRDEIPAGFAPLYIPSRLKRRLAAYTVAVPFSLKYAGRTLAYVFGPQQPPADYMTRGGGWLGLRPSHVYATATDFTDAGKDLAAYQARYAELAMPVGVLYGDRDQVLGPAENISALSERVRDLDVEVLEGIGHMPQFSAPRRTAAFIERMAKRAFENSPARGKEPL